MSDAMQASVNTTSEHQVARPIILLAILIVGRLLYKLYFQKLLQQGKQGKIKIALIAIGLVFMGMAMTGKAHALLAIIGAAMTQIMRIAPILIRFAPSLRRYLGTGALGAAAAKASGAAYHECRSIASR